MYYKKYSGIIDLNLLSIADIIFLPSIAIAQRKVLMYAATESLVFLSYK